jgi:Sulfotransferase family
MISHDHRCIFIHIERTGGTSVELALSGFDWWVKWSRGEKHLTAAAAIARYGRETWDRYLTFSFVRNPWDLVVSCYEFFHVRQGGGLAFRDYVLAAEIPEARTANPSSVWTHSGWWQQLGKSQLDWITDGRGAVVVDFVGRFERLQDDFEALCARIGVPCPPLPHEGRSVRTPYTDYYDDETHEFVSRRFRRDIDYFGYEFGGRSAALPYSDLV